MTLSAMTAPQAMMCANVVARSNTATMKVGSMNLLLALGTTCGAQLTELQFSSCPEDADQPFPAGCWTWFPNLELLSIRHAVHLTKQAVRDLGDLVKLQYLEIHGSCPQPHVNDAMFSKLDNLDTLDLAHCPRVSDRALRKVASEMLYLSLRDVPRVTDDGIRRMKHVRELSLSNMPLVEGKGLCRLSDLDVLFLDACPKLSPEAMLGGSKLKCVNMRMLSCPLVTDKILPLCSQVLGLCLCNCANSFTVDAFAVLESTLFLTVVNCGPDITSERLKALPNLRSTRVMTTDEELQILVHDSENGSLLESIPKRRYHYVPADVDGLYHIEDCDCGVGVTCKFNDSMPADFKQAMDKRVADDDAGCPRVPHEEGRADRVGQAGQPRYHYVPSKEEGAMRVEACDCEGPCSFNDHLPTGMKLTMDAQMRGLSMTSEVKTEEEVHTSTMDDGCNHASCSVVCPMGGYTTELTARLQRRQWTCFVGEALQGKTTTMRSLVQSVASCQGWQAKYVSRIDEDPAAASSSSSSSSDISHIFERAGLLPKGDPLWPWLEAHKDTGTTCLLVIDDMDGAPPNLLHSLKALHDTFGSVLVVFVVGSAALPPSLAPSHSASPFSTLEAHGFTEPQLSAVLRRVAPSVDTYASDIMRDTQGHRGTVGPMLELMQHLATTTTTAKPE